MASPPGVNRLQRAWMKAHAVATAILLACGPSISVTHAAPDPDRTVKKVAFRAGSSSASIEGSIKGRQYVDYQLRAGAGQTLAVGLQASHLSANFNVLPPGSQDAAMFIGGGGDLKFDGVLPDDGVYTVRVYLVRAVARRNENSRFTLSVGVTGAALAPLSAKVDALIAGTRYHAKSAAPCQPPYAQAGECEALVVRRGTDGTATVELRWKPAGKLRVLFVKGRPVAADSARPFTFTKDDRGFKINFAPDERFEVPEPLVFGG